MEHLLGEIISGISSYIGVNIRFHFLKLIGKPKSLRYLKGNSKDPTNNVTHGCMNTIIGIPIVLIILLGVIYILFFFLS